MRFLFIPEFLLDMELSPRAVLAAGLILSRLNLSAVNGENWRDEIGIYCYYSIDDLSADLHIDRRQTSNVFSELLSAGIIDRKRDGNRLYKIYYGSVCHEKNCISDMQKISSQYTIYSINKNSSNSRTRKKSIQSGYPATYDISAYESTSVIDDEEDGGAEV